MISSGGIPLALFLLLRGYRRGSVGLVVAGWLVSAWQMSLGFTLGLQYAYLLAVLAVLLALAWWRGARPVAIDAAALARRHRGRRRALLGAVTVYQARPYLQRLPPLPDRQAHDQGSRELLLRTRRAPLGVLGEPGLGRGYRRARATTCTPRTRTCSSPAG